MVSGSAHDQWEGNLRILGSSFAVLAALMWLQLDCFFYSPLVAQELISSDTIDSSEQVPPAVKQVDEIAGNDSVADFMKQFTPRGVMSDGSQPTSPKEAEQNFRTDSRLRVELVASEPDIAQPLYMSWDSQGRLWVVEYRQYQFPAGLKVVRYDQHLRAVFDRVPEPPPQGPRGADRITLLTDEDRDGSYEQIRVVVDGLNIATSVLHGKGGLWVLNPPYLLFYPDADGDALPDSSPQVCLSGFGLQDTHSVANSLMFGPDGWIYGANGSTTTGNVSSAVTKGVQFEGQCIWRYHPDSREFEIYAEGGGNTFSLEIDSYGRVFSGTNYGSTRGLYYPQGSYSIKNWGKHGPLTNPHAYGFFQHMQSQGDERRFPQAFCIYEGGLLPDDFDGTIIAPNSLHNLVWNSELIQQGSTFRTKDRLNPIESSDRWFRPVYAGVGPDGAIYLADWYDTRLSHVSPLDDWHKTSGRIYRVVPAGMSRSATPIDLTQLSCGELVELMADSHNKWVRQRCALELSWRKDLRVLPRLVELVEQIHSLEALWAIHGMGELTSEFAYRWLTNPNPHIRRWVVRLLGDRHEGLESMVELAGSEGDVEVRSQLAASAKRFDSALGIRILAKLIMRDEDSDDLHLPLMIWWGLEHHVDDWESIRESLSTQTVWHSKMMQQHLAARLMQRCASESKWDRCEQLVQLAGNTDSKRPLMVGLLRTFDGRALPVLPPLLQAELESYQASLGRSGLALTLRQGDPDSIADGLRILSDEQEELALRLEVSKILGEMRIADAKATLVEIACGHQEPALQRTALAAIQNFEDPSIAERLVSRMDSSISEEHGLRDTACRTLASREYWARVLLREIIEWRLSSDKIPADVVQQLRSYRDATTQQLVTQAFGNPVELSSAEKVAELERLRVLVGNIIGDPNTGREVFTARCANCHRLFGEGTFVGPVLDTYERTNSDFWLINLVDPSAEIREGFQSFVTLTRDGSVMTGVLEYRDAAEVILRSIDNQRIRIPVGDIETMEPLPTSLMPNDLLRELSDQQIADLMAYVSMEPN